MNGNQKALVRKYEAITAFEFMGKDDIASGKMSFSDAWHMNIRFMENVLADITNLDTRGAVKKGGAE